jgi:hypothetical protein
LRWYFAKVDRPGAWREFVFLFLGVLFVGVAVIFFLIVLVDPYDSGRFGPGWLSGIVDESPRTASVSRGRDQRFNSAIVGNSHGQLLDPAQLSSSTGLNFVQLTVPGTGPIEQMTVLSWFMKHHDRIGAIVLAADPTWCAQDPSPNADTFPYWLYADSNAEYAANVLRTASLDRGWRRILLAAGLRKASRPDGYWDYELGRVWAFAPKIPDNLTPASGMRSPRRPFPAVDQLRAELLKLPADTRRVVIFPPVFVTALPAAGSDAAEAIAECKGAFSQLMDEQGSFIDFAIDGGEARDPRNFMDLTHYRAAVARNIESEIVAALASQQR